MEDRFRLRLDQFGRLQEDDKGQIGMSASPVLATPALVAAFVGGAALVTGAYAAGEAVG